MNKRKSTKDNSTRQYTENKRLRNTNSDVISGALERYVIHAVVVASTNFRNIKDEPFSEIFFGRYYRFCI
jgi:hypothetical protein